MRFHKNKKYYATQLEINHAISLFTKTAFSAFHPIHIPVNVIIFVTGFSFFSAIMFFYPYHIRLWIISLTSIIIFTIPVLIKWCIVGHQIIKNPTFKQKPPPYKLLNNQDLPVYSVIVPLYKEARIFKSLKKHLEKIDYPVEKLDIILVLEEDDTKTLKIVQKLLRRSNPYNIKQLIIPPCFPRTKPKVLNIALNYIKGSYFVIFDAEDRPEPSQLKKAASYFAILPKNIGALQAKLAYHNTKKTWFLTRMFTLEYDIWFNHFLKGLVDLKLPVPLSGTSTHMRTHDILNIGGWDAYNVTEDCDLGIRLNAANYQTYILDSVTHEEAVSQLPIWIKQRTRWMKGYLQTLISHLRNPRQAYQIFGLYRLIGIYGTVGGQVFSALFYPTCWLFFGFTYISGASIAYMLPENLDLLLNILMITGFILPIIQAIMTVITLKKRYYLILFALLHPLYWMLAGFAAYRAIWQLLYAPFKWEKTPHG